MTKAKEDKDENDVVKPPVKKQGAHHPIDPNAGAVGVGVPDPAEMSDQKYVVGVRSFINGSLVEAGTVVQLPDGVEPGKHLTPVAGSAKGAPTQKAINTAIARAGISEAPTTPVSPQGQMERQNGGSFQLSDMEQKKAFQEGREAENKLADERADLHAEQKANQVKEPEMAGQRVRAANAAGRRLTPASADAKHESKDSDPI